MADSNDHSEATPSVVIPPRVGPGRDPNAAMGDRSPLLALAARGDLEAQRALFRECIGTLAFGPDPSPDPTRSPAAIGLEALHYARLCASHGHPADSYALVNAFQFLSYLMRQQGSDDLADAWIGEALTVLEGLANDGDEHAAMCANTLVATHPHAIEYARNISKGVQ